MRCPNCDLENVESLKFCLRCSPVLLIHCAECGSENIPYAIFCRKCGALTGARASSTRTPNRPPSTRNNTPW
jgi:ribosomal protein L40E